MRASMATVVRDPLQLERRSSVGCHQPRGVCTPCSLAVVPMHSGSPASIRTGRALAGTTLASAMAIVALLTSSTPARATSAGSFEVPMREIRAVRVEVPVQLDGRPDDAIWQVAPRSGDYAQRQPDLGEAPPVGTFVQVAYDDRALYVLVESQLERCEAKIDTLRRDSFDIYNDDAISVKIDPYLDRQSAKIFGANAAGAQVDSSTYEDGRVWSGAWDAVWEVEAHQESQRYWLEFKIPFSVLGLEDGENVAMGFNISRDAPWRNAVYDWRLIVPPRSPGAASTFGTLTGIERVEGKKALELMPYVAGRTDFARRFSVDPRNDPNLSTGLDLRMQMGRRSYLEASFLTDFSQVEADEVQIADDRFALYYDERRPFFLNGLEYFAFGEQGRSQLFFSRRVGLDGRVVGLASGVKAYGQLGPVSYGVMNVQTLGALADPESNDELEQKSVAPENYTVARVRARAGRHLTLGVIGLGRHRFSTPGGESFGIGADLLGQFADDRLRVYGVYAGSWVRDEVPARAEAATEPSSALEVMQPGIVPPEPSTQDNWGNSGQFQVEFQGLYVRPGVQWSFSDAGFKAPLGFYRRPGTARQRAWITFAPRPGVLDLREVRMEPWAEMTTDPHYQHELTRDIGSDFELQWRDGWLLNYSISHRRDRVRQGFELFGESVSARRYSSGAHRVEATSPRMYRVAGTLIYRNYGLFGGRANETTAQLQLRLSRHFSLSGAYSQLFGQFESGREFNFGYANAHMIVAFHRDLVLDALLRLSLEPESERVAVQSRLHWRFRPGSDLYLVYANNVDMSDEQRQTAHEISLKASFYWRALFGRRG